MYILGVSCLYHDSAACLIQDGKIIASAQEERFTRIKHDFHIPENAMKYCLKEAEINAESLDAVVYYDNPLLMTDRFMDNFAFLGTECDSLLSNSFDKIFSWKLWIHEKLKNTLGSLGKHGKLLVTKHHISHAASAFLSKSFVLHEAAWGSVPRSIEMPLFYEANNITGTLNMLEASRKNGVKQFVYASSSSVYGDEPNLPKKEGSEGNLLSPYALTKRCDEEWAKQYTRHYGLETIGLRYFNVFGRRQNPEGAYAAVIPKFIKLLLAGRKTYHKR